MSDWQEIFEHIEVQNAPGSDFESRVFAKIRKKKQQRKIAMGITAAVGVVMLLSLFQLFRPDARRAPAPVAGTIKEEIPVSENLFFSASDNRTRYSLEPVSLGEKSVARDAVPNQI